MDNRQPFPSETIIFTALSRVAYWTVQNLSGIKSLIDFLYCCLADLLLVADLLVLSTLCDLQLTFEKFLLDSAQIFWNLQFCILQTPSLLYDEYIFLWEIDLYPEIIDAEMAIKRQSAVVYWNIVLIVCLDFFGTSGHIRKFPFRCVFITFLVRNQIAR